jgi:mTERF domain-containing protein, mitochondrial
MVTIDDLVSEYHDAVSNEDWTRDFSDLINDLEPSQFENKLDPKNYFLSSLGIEYQHPPRIERDRGEGSLQSHVQSLLYLQSLGVTKLGKVVARLPEVLGLSVKDSLQPHVDYLNGVGVVDIGKVITSFPQIFSYSIENTLRPRVDYLKKLGVIDIGKVITKLPNILCYSIEDHLQPHVDYFKELGVVDIGKVITKLPQIFSYNIENTLQPHIDYLGGLGVTEIGEVITKYPQILGLSIDDNLKPTVDYLMDECYASVKDIEDSPMLVGFSLAKRIKPLHAFLNYKGIKVGSDLAVGKMLTNNDKHFAEKTAHAGYDEWMKFREDFIVQ